jgi:hypothetical protein
MKIFKTTLTFLGLAMLHLLTQCHTNKTLNNEEKSDCAAADSLYNILKSMDFKSYQKREFGLFFTDANLKDYKHMRFVGNNSCLVSLSLGFENGIKVNIEFNSDKKLKRCVKQYSEWRLEDAKEETFDKVTIFKSCDTSDFQHFIFTTNPSKVEPK